MEHCFRIALWMFFFIGYLQANPISSVKDGQSNNSEGKPCRFNVKHLGLNLLLQSVVCDNVNFTIPTDLTEQCHNATLEHFKDELKNKAMNCRGQLNRVDQTLDALDALDTLCTLPTQTNPSMCNWENQGSSKPFAEFVKALEDFAQRLNY